MAEGEKAIALNPNDSTKALAMGVYFVLAGETDRGVELARQAESLIPSPPSWIGMVYTSANYQSGDYEEAMRELSRWDQEDNDVQWHMHKVAILAEMGKIEQAGRELQKAFDLFPAFEEDPIREMRKYLLSEVTLKMYYDSLVKAGLQAELAE
jgi:tetratricopeptide (TPR) repeat protein